jgi:glycosyltransferase involved in cell wall biosynthesis
MRITIVTGPFYPVPPAPCGAVERLWHDLGEHFARQGHQVVVVCRHWPGQNKNETIDGVSYIRRTRMSHTRSIYWDLLQDLWYSLRVLPLLPRADVTVTNVFWLPVLMRARRRAGLVVVNVNRWPKGQMKLYRRAARLAAASSAIREEVIRQCPQVEDRVKVLPNPIDTGVFVPRPRQRAAGAGTILYTGRIHPEKGIHLLVEAFRQLAGEFPELRLRIIGATSIAGGGGGEEYVAALRTRAQGLPIELIGPIYDRAQLAGELQQADYYCYPSLAAQGEAMPVAPVEAMATGLAPVVSALPVFRDYIDPGRTGLLFDHSVSEEQAARNLAEALRRLVTDPAWADQLGQAAAREALRFSYDSVTRQFLDDFAHLSRSSNGSAAA